MKLPKKKLFRSVIDTTIAMCVIMLIKTEEKAQVLKKKGETFFAKKGLTGF